LARLALWPVEHSHSQMLNGGIAVVVGPEATLPATAPPV